MTIRRNIALDEQADLLGHQLAKEHENFSKFLEFLILNEHERLRRPPSEPKDLWAKLKEMEQKLHSVAEQLENSGKSDLSKAAAKIKYRKGKTQK